MNYVKVTTNNIYYMSKIYRFLVCCYSYCKVGLTGLYMLMDLVSTLSEEGNENLIRVCWKYVNILYDCLRIPRTQKFLYAVSDIWN